MVGAQNSRNPAAWSSIGMRLFLYGTPKLYGAGPCSLQLTSAHVKCCVPSMGVGVTTTMIAVVLALSAIAPAGAFLPPRSLGLAHRTATRSVHCWDWHSYISWHRSLVAPAAERRPSAAGTNGRCSCLYCDEFRYQRQSVGGSFSRGLEYLHCVRSET